jgi:hypothetical protein
MPGLDINFRVHRNIHNYSSIRYDNKDILTNFLTFPAANKTAWQLVKSLQFFSSSDISADVCVCVCDIVPRR